MAAGTCVQQVLAALLCPMVSSSLSGPETAAKSAGTSGLAHMWRKAAAHPRWLALVLGVIAAAGFQPLGLWPLALLAMAGLIALIAQADSAKRAGILGWLFGMGYFSFGNNWIATAFTHQAAMPAALGWAAVPVLSVYLAVYPALAAMGARGLAGKRLSWPFILSFAGLWIVSEILRATVFTGYAWNPFAMVLLGPFDRPGLAIFAPFAGSYALSGIAVAVTGAVLLLVKRRRFAAAAGVALVVTAGMYIPAGKGVEGTVALTLVQPDLRQHRINDPTFYEANFQELARLSVPQAGAQQRLVLWPESALPDYIKPGYPQRYYDFTTANADPDFARARIARVIGTQATLLTGATDLKIEGGKATGAYNTVLGLNGSGAIVAEYAKAHLVPYGEYLPLRAVMEPLGLSRLVPGSIDFLPGPGPQTLDLGALGQAGMQICYEIIFSGEVVDRANRPDYIFNPSNDGWFGRFGPPQHLAQARMRAIEEGLPVLRSTTTGISAVIDAKGVVRAHADSLTAARIDTIIPPAAAPTLFSQLGYWLSLVWTMVFLGAALIARRIRDR